MSLREDVAALRDAQENLEADMVALANDALHEGVLVVASFPESVDLSFLQCCSRIGACPSCKKGDFTVKKELPPGLKSALSQQRRRT